MSYQGNSGTVKAYIAEGGAIGAGLAVIAGTAANQVKLPTAANQMPIGITKYAVTAAGQTIEVIEEGYADLVVNATTDIPNGSPITVHGTSGKGALSALTNGLHVFAIARESATEDGDVISVLISRSYLPTA